MFPCCGAKKSPTGTIHIYKSFIFLENWRRIFVRDLPKNRKSNRTSGNIVKTGEFQHQTTGTVKKTSLPGYHENFVKFYGGGSHTEDGKSVGSEVQILALKTVVFIKLFLVWALHFLLERKHRQSFAFC